MNRRDFIKHSTAAVAGTSLLLTACRKESGVKHPEVVDSDPAQMTYRINPNSGDRVSLLGFGMMRLPTTDTGAARENTDAPIDQEAVNEMVDYALAHGVNYFDTSPVYCQGHSEEATGIALSRHPRNSYFIATKMSNFSPGAWPREESQAMFRRSLE